MGKGLNVPGQKTTDAVGSDIMSSHRRIKQGQRIFPYGVVNKLANCCSMKSFLV